MPKDIFRLAYNIHMEAENSDTAEVMLYGEIVEDGPKWWKWSEEDKSAADFDKAIKEARKAGAKKLLLRINSPGGVCTQSVAMRSVLANAGFEEVNIRIEGLCASAATDIATIPGAHVAIAEGSEYMIHNPWCLALGNANELEHTIERLRNIEQMSRGFYMKRTGQSEEQVKEWMDAETWFTADQAVEYGFADEVLTAEVRGETPAAACVTSRVIATMRGLYKTVPGQIAEKEDNVIAHSVSKEAPVAGASSVIQNDKEDNPNVNIKDINMDQLRQENPALLKEIQQEAVAAERQRHEEIDALTVPGYEAMAEAAKKDGTSALDFQKQIVSAMKEKGKSFLTNRTTETAPAQNVPGGAPADGSQKIQDKIEADAKEVAAYAMAYSDTGNEGMF